MTQRLFELMTMTVLKEGPSAKARMAVAIRRGERTVDRYLKKQSDPSPNIAYELAKACGATEDDALAIAKECDAERATETA